MKCKQTKANSFKVYMLSFAKKHSYQKSFMYKKTLKTSFLYHRNNLNISFSNYITENPEVKHQMKTE